MRAQIGTLIIATGVIQPANGIFGTFISLRVASEDFGATLAGLVLSSYFAGFALGAVRCGQIIKRVGHIRAYATFAGLVVAATAAMPLRVRPLPARPARDRWIRLRRGLCQTEIWLNAKAQPSQHGRVFSLYMVDTFLAPLLVSSCRTIPRFVLPEALNKIFLARRTNPAGRERELAKLSSCSRSSASKTNTAFGRPTAMGTSIVHGRCIFPAILMPVIYGT